MWTAHVISRRDFDMYSRINSELVWFYDPEMDESKLGLYIYIYISYVSTQAWDIQRKIYEGSWTIEPSKPSDAVSPGNHSGLEWIPSCLKGVSDEWGDCKPHRNALEYVQVGSVYSPIIPNIYCWLVVCLPLGNILKSIGMIILTIWEIVHIYTLVK